MKKTKRPIVDPRPELSWDEVKRQYLACHPGARMIAVITFPVEYDYEYNVSEDTDFSHMAQVGGATPPTPDSKRAGDNV